MDNNAEAAKLKNILMKIQSDLAAIKSGASTQQLQNTSLEISEGRGYIPIMENGVEKHRIGRQPDGTITSVSVNNNNPPATPLPPVCTPFIGGVTVSCTGFTQTQYLDFSHINVWVDGNIVATLMKVPEAIAIAPLDYQPHQFQLSSVNLSNTESPRTAPVVATPNTAVSADLAAGIIDTLKLKDGAITAAKIATQAITNQQIAPQTILGTNITPSAITSDLIAANTIQGNDIAAQAITALQIAANTITAQQIASGAIQADEIAAGAVNADKIAASSVTSDKVAANAITALQLAANAVTAASIQAGSVTAEKLSAQIVLGTQIVAGSLTDKRIVIDSTGLTQVDAKGNISMQIGVTSAKGNSFTVIDPTDPSNALASVGADGSMTMSGISINGTASINGVDLINFLNSVPQGVVAQGKLIGSTPSTTSEIGLFEISANVVAGRIYQVLSDPMRPQGGYVGLAVHYTTDGSIPKVSSTVLTSVYGPADDVNSPTNSSTLVTNYLTHFHYQSGGGQTGNFNDSGHNHYQTTLANTIQFNCNVNVTFTGRLRLLFTILSAQTSRPSVSAIAANLSNTNLYLIDQGLQTTSTGGTNAGSGTTNATGQYTTTWSPTYTSYYGDKAGTTNPTTGLQQGMAGTTNYMSMLGFNFSNIQSVLSGATIVKVELYLYSNYWSLSSGGVACVGTHNNSSSTAPSSYSYVAQDTFDQTMKKPQGLWLQLPVSVGNNFRDNTIKGLVLDSRTSYPGTGNYGIFRDITYTDSTVQPSLRITYTK